MEKNLDELYKIYNIMGTAEKNGTAYKEMLRKRNIGTGEVEQGIFKSKFAYGAVDNVIEAFIYEIAKKLAIPCCKAIVCRHNNEIGSFSRYEVPDGCSFSTLDAKSGVSSAHIDELWNIVSSVCTKRDTELRKLLCYMCLDYITGQQDRHLQNIAVLSSRHITKLYPLYDNGLALFGNHSNNQSAHLFEADYYSGRTGSKEEMLEFLEEKMYYCDTDIAAVLSNKLSTDVLMDTLERVDIYSEISAKRKENTTKFIRNRIRELVNIRR